MVTLRTSDGQHFSVGDNEVVPMSQTLKCALEELGEGEGEEGAPVPLPNVNGKTLGRVIEYCKFHVEARETGPDGKPAKSEEDVKAWDKKFLDELLDNTQHGSSKHGLLFDTILAANYLNIKDLLDLTCRRVADMIKGKTTEEIRQEFDIKNDFTPEEEEEVRRENQWAFD